MKGVDSSLTYLYTELTHIFVNHSTGCLFIFWAKINKDL